MQKTDCSGLDARLVQRHNQAVDRRLIERCVHFTVGQNPLGDRETPMAWDDQIRLVQIDIVLAVPALISNLEDISEAFGSDRRNASAPAFDQRIGSECRTVDETRNICNGPFCPSQHAAYALQRTDGGADRCGGRFGCSKNLVVRINQYNITECAADIDGDPEHLFCDHGDSMVARHLGIRNTVRENSVTPVEPG